MTGTVLANRYEIVREIGRGGMGVVYLARDLVLEREVAVKLLAHGQPGAESAERFRREARVLAKMDHPGIVPLHDFAEHEGAVFIVMPFVAGTSLRRVLRDRRLEVGEVLELGIQVAEALDYSHSLGVVHRDVKPENILVAADASGAVRARLTDFGIAAAEFEEHDTEAGAIVGTGAYLSPEQISEGEVDARADIYALGSVLYECLAGRTPFAGAGTSLYYRITFAPPRPIRPVRPELDEQTEKIVLRCIEKDPSRRPESARQLAEALRGRRAAGPAGSPLPAPPQPAARSAPPAAFVDRERELAELGNRLSWAVAGEAQLVLVAGEAGVGKSRLIEELDAAACRRGVRVVHGRFLDHDRSFPYQGFCDVIQEHFLTEVTAGPGAGADFSDLSPELAALFPSLGELASLKSSTGSRASGSRASGSAAAFSERTEIFELLSRAIARIGGGHPLVVLLEEIHASDVSAEALQYIARRLGATPTLFVATYRTSEVDRAHPVARLLDSFRGDRRFAWIRLEPFPADRHRELVLSLLGAEAVEPAFLDRLFEVTEGNAFFATELVRALVDSGALRTGDGGVWALADAAGLAGELPETIQQTVEGRLKRLDRAPRELLAVASVLGRSFAYRELELLAGDRGDLEETVDWLVEVGLLEETRDPTGERLAFASQVVRDVVYTGLSRRRRRALHLAYARRLERGRGGRRENLLPQLVHHYQRAADHDRVAALAIKLARRSLDAYAAEEAARAARAALEALAALGADDPAREGLARRMLAEALGLGGDAATAIAELDRAAGAHERAREPVEAVECLCRAAELAWASRRTELAEERVERGLAAARALEAGPRAGAVRARLLTLAATLANLGGEFDLARRHAAELDEQRGSALEAEPPLDRAARLVVALPAPIRSSHPVDIRSRAEEEAFANVVETLVATDAQGVLVPRLCERWEMNGTATRFRASLAGDLRTHDGQAVSAADVARAFEAAILRCRGELPAAFAAIAGAREFRAGAAERVAGLRAPSATLVEMRLAEPTPIFPALLTDLRTAVAFERLDGPEPRLAGTGPFSIASLEPDRVLLARVADPWRGAAAGVAELELRGNLRASEIAAGLRSGEIDVARGLAAEELEELVRDRRRRFRLLEAPGANAWFLLFNAASPAGSRAALRAAVGALTRPDDLVRQALGRLALPADGILPPGTLGHDPNRRRPAPLEAAEVDRLLGEGAVERPARLRLGVVAAFADRYGALLEALVRVWERHGIEVATETPRGLEHFDSAEWIERIDLLAGGWHADYNDPDDFTYALFHSGAGVFRRYMADGAIDALLEEGRRLSAPGDRARVYREVESRLLESGAVIPLFHELEVRVAARRVERLALCPGPPYVDYRAAGVAAAPSAPRRGGGGVPVVPLPVGVALSSLDPALIEVDVEAEVVATVFETLTRHGDGARTVPWLAASVEPEQGGRRYRFRLRDNVLFHDGRLLTARDVRYSLERMLADERSVFRWQLAPVRGAADMLSGARDDLAGFRILSRSEFTIDLEHPLAFFPALLSHPAAAVVPEGCRNFAGSSAEGTAGTGPFRVARFEPGARLELAASPTYWRSGLPLCDGLVFEVGLDPRAMLAEFVAGRASVAFNLFPEDEEALRRDPAFAAGYREAPCMQTVLLAFNTRRGPFAGAAARRRLAASLDVAAIVRRAGGRLGTPARGLIPPGLLGSDAARPQAAPRAPEPALGPQVAASCLMRPLFAVGSLARFRAALFDALAPLGVRAEPLSPGRAEWDEARRSGAADLFLLGWNADYPDADAFAHGLLHSASGWLGAFCGTPEIDRLVERARAGADPDLRRDLYGELEEVVARDALLVPLFHSSTGRFARPELRGLEVSLSTPFVAYDKLWLER